MRRAVEALVLVACVTAVTNAEATYSAPLTEVRIHTNEVQHTASIVRATERRTFSTADVDLTGWGAQYIGQINGASGFSLLVGLAGGYGEVDGRLSNPQHPMGATDVVGEGGWVGGQLRGAYMLWASSETTTDNRPSAVTAFVNLRTLYYNMSDDTGLETADLRFFTLTGGIGAMAEWSVNDYISICPYAWATPAFTTQLDWTIGVRAFQRRRGHHAQKPILGGPRRVDLPVAARLGRPLRHLRTRELRRHRRRRPRRGRRARLHVLTAKDGCGRSRRLDEKVKDRPDVGVVFEVRVHQHPQVYRIVERVDEHPLDIFLAVDHEARNNREPEVLTNQRDLNRDAIDTDERFTVEPSFQLHNLGEIRNAPFRTDHAVLGEVAGARRSTIDPKILARAVKPAMRDTHPAPQELFVGGLAHAQGNVGRVSTDVDKTEPDLQRQAGFGRRAHSVEVRGDPRRQASGG